MCSAVQNQRMHTKQVSNDNIHVSVKHVLYRTANGSNLVAWVLSLLASITHDAQVGKSDIGRQLKQFLLWGALQASMLCWDTALLAILWFYSQALMFSQDSLDHILVAGCTLTMIQQRCHQK